MLVCVSVCLCVLSFSSFFSRFVCVSVFTDVFVLACLCVFVLLVVCVCIVCVCCVYVFVCLCVFMIVCFFC